MHNISSKKTAIIIVAAGRGARAGMGVPKQYHKMGGDMVLTKTIRRFLDFEQVMVVIHPDDIELYKQAISGINGDISYCFGGKTRNQSVKSGIEALNEYQPQLVLIHDAARPFVKQEIIRNIIHALDEFEAVAPALPSTDALKKPDGESIDRTNVLRVQTPQGFHFKKIKQAFDKIDNNSSFDDDIAIAYQANMKIGFIKGDEQNTKLTYKEDFKVQEIPKTASGFDVHKICAGESLKLCGVKIDCGFALQGHSDADVGLHALTDALLGSISAGDIGTHFPPNDEKWKNADSAQFLTHAGSLVKQAGGEIAHIDITIICERPKITPHRDNMRKKIAEILGINKDNISVKATTTEKLGAIGRGEGIAANAIATILIPKDYK